MELIGDERNRLCEYACGRNFEVLKWAHNQLELPWAPYRAGPVSDDVLVLRVLRESPSYLKQWWPEDEGPEEWGRVTMVEGGVVELVRECFGLRAVPAELGQLASLRVLRLSSNRLTSLPAEIGQLTSLEVLVLGGNKLTSLPAELGQLTSLENLRLVNNQLTSVPAEIWHLTSLRELLLANNKLTTLPVEIGQMIGLEELNLTGNQFEHFPHEAIRALERYTCCKVYTDTPSKVPSVKEKGGCCVIS